MLYKPIFTESVYGTAIIEVGRILRSAAADDGVIAAMHRVVEAGVQVGPYGVSTIPDSIEAVLSVTELCEFRYVVFIERGLYESLLDLYPVG
jgi:hypothetical protein